MINSEVGKEIKRKRRLRQSDPLSPLLFILFADGLNVIIKRATEEKLI